MQNLITRYKTTNRPAADLYHDVMRRGLLVDWMQENIVPILDEHGYPYIGTQEWGQVEKEIIDTFLRNKTGD